MNHETGAIEVKDGFSLLVNESDVELVLGVPCKHRNVMSEGNVSELELSTIRKLLMLKPGADITLECLEKILTQQYARKMNNKEREAFKVAFVLCADAYFLGPKGARPKINQEMFRNLIDTTKIADMNWCGYVLRSLFQSAKRIKHSIAAANKTTPLDGRLLFPVVSQHIYECPDINNPVQI